MQYVYLLFSLFLLTSCGLDDGKPTVVLYEHDLVHEGMVLIGAKGQTVKIGTNNPLTKATERPSMRVKFTYNFSISRNEVTRAEYSDLMGGKPTKRTQNFPITDLTYYDAVLYANARSKEEGFDTAYTYSDAFFNVTGSCVNLEGLNTRFNTDAYRLPTEAEWVFVASQNWNPENSWNNKNSNYALQNVCSADINDVDVCDMAGNVMEWVNDWLDYFKDTTIFNFVGASDGGTLGERVIKGGSYRNVPTDMNTYSRGDIYKVTSSTTAPYVGFRLVFGAIPNPVWMSSAGFTSESHVASLSTAAWVKTKTRTYKTKLIFRNNETKNLAYFDYSSSPLSLVEIADTLDAYHPEISPDGNRVAFCTRPEGVSGPSAVYVRDLDRYGSNLVKLNVKNAAIPRWRILQNGDTAIVYVTDPLNNKDQVDWKKESTWQVVFSKGQFGTPIKLYDGTFHGGVSEDGSLALTGARLLRANINGKDTLWYNGEQACNAALSKDSSKRTLFLDFASETGREFIGQDYSVHQRLFIVDSVGNLIQSIKAPTGYTFDHTEWTSKTNLMVTSLTNSNGANTKIALINARDLSLLDLAEGGDLWHPCLWSRKEVFQLDSKLLDLDSAGVYYTEGNPEFFEVLQLKMEMFWRAKDSLEYLFIGSSRIEFGVNPALITSPNTLNMGHSGNRLYNSLYFFRNYVVNHCKQIKGIAISIDFDLWHGWDDFHLRYLYETPGYLYDSNHGFWKEGLPTHFIEALDYNNPVNKTLETAFLSTRGFNEKVDDVLFDGKVPEFTIDSLWTEYASGLISRYLILFESSLALANEKNIQVVGVVFPQQAIYKTTGSFGRYGPRRSVAIKITEGLKELEKKFSNFHLIDENKMGEHDYINNEFYDYDHLNGLGATKLTTRLDSLLQTLP